ncbi:hypothetical protein DCS_00788 [Drechmeria coniospora]|uniref:Uncharacterized protein n=1 Tax=Drechmeria coniospora TaxID=98403 RepID=A0A151GRA1_DRECN|nr:hypothetical protein DCS_00788 [Drechmeria coniospora]KYK59654.1 hypothetical protein DCS_00788 [Drechmeria coniospora]
MRDLSAAVDVYGEWVDAADAVAKENTEGDANHEGVAQSKHRPGSDALGGGDDERHSEDEGTIAVDDEH